MTALAPRYGTARHRIRVAGVVQGVGFRPFVHRLATELDLAGYVGNDSQGVLLEVEGDASDLVRFEARLVGEAPPLARIAGVEAQPVDVKGERTFRIVESRTVRGGRTFVSPDTAVCDDCLAEMWDPGDRRYRYPFINCTNCGPRFTITARLPYDRPNTTMQGFALCPACAEQYRDPADRRFHAQPLACATCGPRLWFEGPGGRVEGSDAALAAAQGLIADGGVVAVKGLGGYHLACDATSDAAVGELRGRKHRPDKPLAVMVADRAAAAELAFIDPAETGLLVSPERPIVLLRRRPGGPLSDLVAPGSPHVGVLLPYSPVHHLLLAPVPGRSAATTPGSRPPALVMTSGNLSDEPICYDDTDARRRLGPLVDGWLLHDRPIHVPCDDSVVRVVPSRRTAGPGPTPTPAETDELPIRRSRGYAPLPVRLPFEVEPLLAVGGELKNAFCLVSGSDAWMSQHIGDMGSVETLAAFERSTRQFSRIYGVEPVAVVADAHPGYQTRRWAESRTGPEVVLVQHHHAHIASVMVEHGVPPGEEVIGYAFDGTGYGSDGAIWGGEVLVGGYGEMQRVAHLGYVPLPGGDAAIRKPYRAALAHLWAAGIDWTDDLAPVAAASATERTVLARQLERGVHCVPSSSMGRLFDALSSLIGLRHVVSYEAQAAIELELLAVSHPERAGRPYRLEVLDGQVDPGPLLRAVVDDLRSGVAAGAIAAGVHAAVADLVAGSAAEISAQTGIRRVALSGGVFQNVLLLELVRARLEASGLRALSHRLVPPNDGGLALGQAAVAGYRRSKEV